MSRINRENYLKVAKEREDRLLYDAGATYRGRKIYTINRMIVADLAQPIICSQLGIARSPNILEIGCGAGDAILQILDMNKGFLGIGGQPAHKIVGTSLSPLAEHDRLRERGVKVVIDIAAEKLPWWWRSSFNIVLASVVLQWTQLDMAMPEIKRVLKPGGVLVGYDSHSQTAMIADQANRLGMRDLLASGEYGLRNEAHCDLYPFAWQKN